MYVTSDAARRRDTDRFAIAEMLNSHHFLVDLGDERGCSALYASDARFEGPHGRAVGPRSIARLLRRASRERLRDGGRYLMGPVVVDVTDDSARARSYWWVVSSDPEPSVHTIVYHDALRRVGDAWQIVHRRQETHPTWLGAARARRRRRHRHLRGA